MLCFSTLFLPCLFSCVCLSLCVSVCVCVNKIRIYRKSKGYQQQLFWIAYLKCSLYKMMSFCHLGISGHYWWPKCPHWNVQYLVRYRRLDVYYRQCNMGTLWVLCMLCIMQLWQKEQVGTADLIPLVLGNAVWREEDSWAPRRLLTMAGGVHTRQI